MIYEENVIGKNPFKVDIRFASVYPNVYRTAMSSLGYQIIYSMVNDREDSWCERIIYPNTRSIESNSPLKDFDIISFSLQYEQDYFNCLEILKKGEIPLKRKDRDNSYPLIIAGGPCASSNPLPISDFIDIFIIGEAEAILNKFLDKFLEIKKNKDKFLETNKNKTSKQFLKTEDNVNNKNNTNKKIYHLDPFLDIKGIYIPEYDNPVEKAIVSNMDDAYHITNPIITKTKNKEYLPVFGNSILLNVSRGCSRGCRFCMAGYMYRPLRETSLNKLIWVAEEARKNTGIEKVSLIGAAVSDYSKIDELITKLLNRKFQISTPSLRIESITEKSLANLKESGAKTITIAPESIYTIRKSLNKDISDEKIANVVKNALELDFNVKLYFLIGSPNETKEDIHDLAIYIKYLNSLNHKIAKSSSNYNRSIKFSINPLIPKPHTPLQWEGYDIKDIKSKINYLKSQLKGLAIKFDSPKMGLIQYVLSCKGSEIGKLLEKSTEKKIAMKEWKKFSNSYGLEEELPWKNIGLGLNPNFLKKERKKLLANESTPWCEENYCYGCGSC
ncbi:MAG: radical SAM protein [Methanobrevibacter sp.]|nr:radical SAM protein [Methanobrevibacter sp.]